MAASKGRVIMTLNFIFVLSNEMLPTTEPFAVICLLPVDEPRKGTLRHCVKGKQSVREII